MPSPAQIRAARALLGISALELSKLSNVDLRTVQRFETAEGERKSRSGTLERIIETLEAEGVVFTGDPNSSPGVQLYRKATKEGKSQKVKGKPSSKWSK